MPCTSTTTAAPTSVTVPCGTKGKETQETVQETEQATSAMPTMGSTTMAEEIEESTAEPSITAIATEIVTESETTLLTKTSSTSTPLAGFRESVSELDKPDLSRIYRRLFPYLNSDRH
ncbi:hypothetical protein COOONC_09670 [Cooperia oncophora]